MFTKYLVSREVSEYVTERYVDYHATCGSAQIVDRRNFDDFVLRIVRRAPWCLSFVDSYTSVFVKHSLLRNKLIVLLAILECTPPYCDEIDSASRKGPLITAAAMAVRLAAHLCRAAVAATILVPASWWCRRQEQTAKQQRSIEDNSSS